MHSLTHKELRECAGILAAGVLALFAIAAAHMGVAPMASFLAPRGAGQIPFVSDSFTFQLGLAAFALAAVLGFRQSLGDFRGEAHLFLLHRPVTRRRVYGTKLVVGLAAYFALIAAAILAYAVWAATPGTHASPFAWSMTVSAWTVGLATSLTYLGAFLSGICPAAWLGTRLAPLAATAGASLLAVGSPAWIAWPAVMVCGVALAISILHVAATRDFA